VKKTIAVRNRSSSRASPRIVPQNRSENVMEICKGTPASKKNAQAITTREIKRANLKMIDSVHVFKGS
jgi:hypothetical protein